MSLLYGNAAAVKTTLGGGTHGPVGLLMSDKLYKTLSPTQPYIAPSDPGPPPPFPNPTNTEAVKTYKNHCNMDDALKTQIIEAVEDDYLVEKNNKYTGYMASTARDLLVHLLDRYGNISAADLEQNKTEMEKPLDPSIPIASYYKRIEDAMQYAEDGNSPFTEEQILNTAYLALLKTGVYELACKVWRHKIIRDPTMNTWVNFKDYFALEYRDNKEQERVTASMAGFHIANAAHQIPTTPPSLETSQISDAIENLAMAATNDRDIVTKLVENNKQLAQSVQVLTEQLKIATDAYKTIAAKIANTNRNWEPHGYCWSHGFKVSKTHNSLNCGSKAPGHKDSGRQCFV